LMCPAKVLPEVTPDMLESYVASQYTPDKMVVAAAGYEHSELVNLVETYFGHLLPGTSQKTLASAYQGGELRQSSDEELTHIALGFESGGWNDSALIPICVLSTMMGGGSSFSAGGPGKGIYTRLYQNILNQNEYVQAASVFNAFYNDTGIFGVYACAPPEVMGTLVAGLTEELKKMAGPIKDVELSRAKNQLKSSLLMNLESRPILFEDIGRQVLTYGKHIKPADLVSQIEKVTAADINKAAAIMLKSPLSVVVHGDTTSVPSYTVLQKQF